MNGLTQIFSQSSFGRHFLNIVTRTSLRSRLTNEPFELLCSPIRLLEIAAQVFGDSALGLQHISILNSNYANANNNNPGTDRHHHDTFEPIADRVSFVIFFGLGAKLSQGVPALERAKYPQ